MSATFKNAKRKLAQNELRKYMNEHKTKNQKATKIESPLAKYNEAGQLMCILCKSVVRSEAVWTVHVNAKQHRENVEIAKKLKEKTNNFTTAAKRGLSPPTEVPEKKIKSILKNGTNKHETVAETSVPVAEKPIKNPATNEMAPQETIPAPKDGEILPEGFFDDPKLDAKARNQEYKDPIEEEWERFQKEMREVDHESSAIIAEDQEEATTERQIDEIDEQMKNLSKVLDLEKKKVEVISTKGQKMEIDEESSTEEEADVDEFLDWRAKGVFVKKR